MRKFLFLLVTVLLFSCQKDAQEVTHNGDFKVEFLFEHEGCKIYRFSDGRTVYWADCRGKINHDYTTHTGKSTTTTHRMETIIVDSLDKK